MILHREKRPTNSSPCLEKPGDQPTARWREKLRGLNFDRKQIVPGWEERSKRMLREYGAPTPAEVEWADGIVFGTSTRFGNASAELKAFIDSLGALWFQGKLNGKAAGAFTSTAGPQQERSIPVEQFRPGWVTGLGDYDDLPRCHRR
jgi:hypothetical protein